ncbi:MAG: LysR family transcriptional regulator [Maricaulaceae bacterium]
MVDLRLIRHFEAVYRLGSFSKAADELSLTHSTLTKSIKTLEADWGTQLFHRTTRTVAPTEAGKRLHPMAVDLLGFAQSVKEKTVSGAPHLNIVSGPAALETLVGPAILKFRTDFPKTKISAETMPPALAAEEILQRRAHMMVYHNDTLSGLPHIKRLKIQRLAKEPYVIVFRPGHPVTKTDFSISAITQFDWSVAGYDSIFEANLPAKIRDVLAQNNFPRYRLLSQSACLSLSEKSDILTTVPRSVAFPYVEAGTLCAAPHPAALTFSVSAATLIDAGTEPTLQAFIEGLQQVLHPETERP